MTAAARAARALGAGVLGALLWLAPPHLGTWLPWVVALALLAGLPHGALDHQLARHTPAWRGPVGQLGFHALYLLSVTLVLAAWWWVPSAGVVLLLATAAWHFGESDLLHLGPALRRWPLIWSRGAVLVWAPLVAHPDLASELLATIDASALASLLATIPPGSGWVLVALHVGLVASHVRSAAAPPGVLLDAAAVSLLVVGGGPALGFALYFAGWHTLDHFSLAARDRHLRGSGWVGLAREAWPRTLVSLVGIVVLAVWIDPGQWNRAVLWAIGALTLPHALVVHFSLGQFGTYRPAPLPAPTANATTGNSSPSATLSLPSR